MLTLGLDIGGTCVKAALLRDGETVETRVSSNYRRPTQEQVRDAMAEVTRGYATLAGVGLCVPGILNDERTRVLLSANLPGLMELHLPDLWRGLAPKGVVASDQTAAAVDYSALHTIRGRLLSISIGTGVGAAVLDCDDAHPLGVPLRVNGESPGHLGQVDVSLEDDPPLGPDGGAGGVEAYLGAAAMGSTDPTTLSMTDPPIRALVRLLRITHALYRPHHIALLGGIGRRLVHLRHDLLMATSDRLTRLARDNWQLGFGADDHHAARGAARLATGDQF